MNKACSHQLPSSPHSQLTCQSTGSSDHDLTLPQAKASSTPKVTYCLHVRKPSLFLPRNNSDILRKSYRITLKQMLLRYWEKTLNVGDGATQDEASPCLLFLSFFHKHSLPYKQAHTVWESIFLECNLLGKMTKK